VHQPQWNEWFPWLVNYVTIDGKFRGMFAALFGVGLVVFIERARSRGAPARWLQLRRLWWLAVFGALHYVFLFEGDILLQYALLGVVAMWMVFWKPRVLLCISVLALLLDSTMAGIVMWRDAQAEKVALSLPVTAPERIEYEQYWQGRREAVTEESEVMAHGGLRDILAHRFVDEHGLRMETVLEPALSLRYVVLQYLPMMLIGAALFRLGFFTGGWDRRRMLRWGLTGIATGWAAALAMGLWLMHEQWRFALNYFVFYGPVHILRLPVTLGYMAVLVALAPQLIPRPLGQRFVAAGQMALTNYLGMSFVMALIFQGWGLGLFDRFERFEQWGFLLLGCVLMLGWSKPWIAHFRFGPLEWLWRCLTYWRLFPLKRSANSGR